MFEKEVKVMDDLLNYSIEDLKRGFTDIGECFQCLLCGLKIEKGIIYKDGERLYEAEKYTKLHINNNHGSVFEYLLKQDKKITGLSELQNKLLYLFWQGQNDVQIQKELGVGNSSTIRNHRFMMKERERQARILVVLMELLREHNNSETQYIEPNKTAKMVDDRYNITEKEKLDILGKYFKDGLGGRLSTFSMKEKSKLVVLSHIATSFKKGIVYTEKQINEILKNIYDDFATLRRYLIEYGFLDRKSDGSEYWLKEAEKVDNRKELIQQYKETKIIGGVYQIKNNSNGKIFLTSTPDFKTINGKKLSLNMGSFMNKELQAEWKTYGEESFSFDILEALEEKETGYFNKKDELKKLLEKWMDSLKPYGEKGYHREK